MAEKLIILGNIKNDGKILKGGFNFLVNELNSFYSHYFEVKISKDANLSFP